MPGKFAFTALVLAVMSIGVACGGSSEGSLSDYFEEIGRAYADRESEVKSAEDRLLEADAEAGNEEAQVQASRDNLDELIRITKRLRDSLEEIEPPDEVAQIHSRAVEANRDALEILEELARQTSNADSVADLQTALGELGGEEIFADAEQRAQQSCSELQGAADTNGAGVELYCVVRRVEGHAMDPTLPDGTRVSLRKYGDGRPAYGDIVLFLAPTSPDREFIKRVIGLPGDRVEIDQNNGDVIINGDRLDEPYVLGTTSCSQVCTWQVPEENTAESEQPLPTGCASDACYFVLGDNRQNSSDSRQGWLVPIENILGRVATTGQGD